jgi:phage terminase large subunit-like protein
MSYSPPTKTVGDVYAQVKRVFGDESGVQLTNEDIARWINEAQADIAQQNQVLQAKANMTLTPNVATYDLSAITPRIDSIASILLDGRRIGYIPVSQAEESISLSDPASAEIGAPQFWYEWAGEITFWPVPGQAYDMLIRYTAEPDDVTTTTTDVLSVPDECFSDVCNYVLMRAYEMDENAEMMAVKQAEYSTSVAERGETERQAATMTYETAITFELL